MLGSAVESFAPPPDGFSYAGSDCFRLSALHLHCGLKHLHPFNLQQNGFALLHSSQGLMFRVITIVYLPCTHEAQQILPIFKAVILFIAFYQCTSQASGITVSYYPQQRACRSDRMKYVNSGLVMKVQMSVLYCSSMFPASVDVAEREVVPRTPLPSLQICPDQSAVLL